MMYYLVYISISTKLLDEKELAKILSSSVKNNLERAITGMLIYSDGTFIQALEGDEGSVKSLLSTVENDDRHKNVIMLTEGEHSERVFPEWSMAFLTPEPEKMTELTGYINPLKDKLFNERDGNPILNMLRMFADDNSLTHL